ncbi:DUF948 domain-containing protein [Cohnella silvisoli]|uniref:DUF948 domain-containing protein n=1 Tax=Cohnella silvisoli TaxID=2873699 RepID=A0ABV1L4F3_9BACL|nr:DUF948 domain-containing protein [Cohnella silvisoli]MCD9025972.1 DUF948 domain-containing protein [Cohnella silvisoli]
MENNDIMTWSIMIAVIAFVVLCVFLVSLLRTAQRSLMTAQSAMQEVKETVEGLQGEVKKLAESINDVADDIRGKLQSTDPLFDAVQDVGIMLSEVTGTAREATKSITHSIKKQAASIENGSASPSWMQWAVLGSRVLMGIQKGWKQREQSHSYTKEEI